MHHKRFVAAAVCFLWIVGSSARSLSAGASPTPAPPMAGPSPSVSPSPFTTGSQPDSANSSPPIVVLGCDYPVPGVLKMFLKHNAIGHTDHLQVDYKNNATKTANKVVFGVYVSGTQVGEITDLGTFPPNTEQKHVVYGAQTFTFGLGNTECRAIQVEFADSSIWQSSVVVTTLAVAQGGNEVPSPEPSLSPATRKAPNPIAAKLYNDPAYFACRSGNSTTSNGADLSVEFACVYRAQDYRAAEIIGESLLLSATPVNQGTIYQLANASYLRGNSSKALQYARIGYGRLDATDKTNCTNNANSCADLRTLLAKLDAAYRKEFVIENAQAKARADEAARQAQAAAAAAARVAAATVLDINGSGSHSTEAFTVNNEWELDWSYDCSNFGGSGNFIVDVKGDVDGLGVNQLGSGDSGTEYFHQGGNIYLEINSECSWTVKVVNE
jgi:hypothetical protein